MAAGAVADSVLRFLDLHEEAHVLQVRNDLLPCFLAGHAVVLARLFIERAVQIHDHDGFEVVPFPYGKVVRVMCRGDLHAAGAVFRIDVFIGDDRNFAAHGGQKELLADEAAEPFILRIDRHRGIAGDGFRTGRGDLHIAVFSDDRIIDVIQMAHFILMLHFDIGESGLAAGAPVRDAVALIDQALFIKGAEHFPYSAGAYGVHGEAFPGPVTGGTQLADLTADGIAVFFLPLPHPFQEFFTAQIVLREAFLGDLLLYLDLRGDACMVLAGEPEHIVALHALVADEDILQGAVQCVAHVQLSRDIRRRQNDAERFRPFLRFVMEYAVRFPVVVPFFLDL